MDQWMDQRAKVARKEEIVEQEIPKFSAQRLTPEPVSHQ
jgi:hypothetical protein